MAKYYDSETNKRKLFSDGHDLWYEYIRVNGYSWTFNNAGLKKLSRSLDLNIPYLRKRINAFLEA